MKGGHKMFEYQAKVINVVDGDTLDAEVDLGFKIYTKQRLRLAHVDAPERSEAKYTEAKEFVKNAVLNKEVRIKTSKPSKWGYFLAEIYINNESLADMLVIHNLAKKYEGGAK
jgi:micrococcal nuclease